MPDIETIRKTIEEAEAVLITDSTSMGVGSGLPNFRGNEGSSMLLDLVEEFIRMIRGETLYFTEGSIRFKI